MWWDQPQIDATFPLLLTLHEEPLKPVCHLSKDKITFSSRKEMQSLSIPFWTCCNISIRARLRYRISTSRGEQDGMSRSNTISVCLQYVLNNTV